MTSFDFAVDAYFLAFERYGSEVNATAFNRLRRIDLATHLLHFYCDAQ